MTPNSFVQSAALFAYSGTDCVRNDYYHNSCAKCVDICPEGAFHIVRNKLTLFDNECIACGACLGSCPTEALTLENFDPNTYVEAFAAKEETLISCKKEAGCLGGFDAHHYATMALLHEKMPVCDLSHCAECALNKTQKVAAFIQNEIETANTFLHRTGYSGSISVRTERETVEQHGVTAEPARRMVFKKAVAKAVGGPETVDSYVSLTMRQRRRNDTALPLKYEALKRAVAQKLSRFERTAQKERSPLFTDKVIDFQACTNCRDCVQFCPTSALKSTPDSQGILFTQSHCIGCGICDHICKTDAITTAPGYDLVEIAYDRTKQLVHYEMVQCHECRCPYPYKGGDPICDRCEAFLRENANMFTLARDL